MNKLKLWSGDQKYFHDVCRPYVWIFEQLEIQIELWKINSSVYRIEKNTKVIGIDSKKELQLGWWISAIQNISQEIWISSAEKIHVHNASLRSSGCDWCFVKTASLLQYDPNFS